MNGTGVREGGSMGRQILRYENIIAIAHTTPTRINALIFSSSVCDCLS